MVERPVAHRAATGTLVPSVAGAPPRDGRRPSAFDGYNRGLQWERTCAEVTKLKISRRPMGQGERF